MYASPGLSATIEAESKLVRTHLQANVHTDFNSAQYSRCYLRPVSLMMDHLCAVLLTNWHAVVCWGCWADYPVSTVAMVR